MEWRHPSHLPQILTTHKNYLRKVKMELFSGKMEVLSKKKKKDKKKKKERRKQGGKRRRRRKSPERTILSCYICIRDYSRFSR
jgi:hypothetical protein